MPWVKTDDAAPHHGKFFRAGLLAYGFWHACLSYCNRWLTDGHIPTRELSLIFPGATPQQVEECVEALVRERVLEVTESGYYMHDYLQYQPSRREVLRLRREKSRAGRKGAEVTRKRWGHSAVAPAAASALVSDRPPTQPDPTQPDPTHKAGKETALSGSSPDAANGNGHRNYRQEAREVLAWLNEKAGKRFEFNDTNLDLIAARLREGGGRPAWLLKKLVSVKAKAWSSAPGTKPSAIILT